MSAMPGSKPAYARLVGDDEVLAEPAHELQAGSGNPRARVIEHQQARRQACLQQIAAKDGFDGFRFERFPDGVKPHQHT